MLMSRNRGCATLSVRLATAVGVLLFHAVLLVHVSTVALVIVAAGSPRSYACEQVHARSECGWWAGVKLLNRV